MYLCSFALLQYHWFNTFFQVNLNHLTYCMIQRKKLTTFTTKFGLSFFFFVCLFVFLFVLILVKLGTLIFPFVLIPFSDLFVLAMSSHMFPLHIIYHAFISQILMLCLLRCIKFLTLDLLMALSIRIQWPTILSRFHPRYIYLVALCCNLQVFAIWHSWIVNHSNQYTKNCVNSMR